MKLKYQFVTNEVAGNMIAVATGDGMEKFSGFVKMDQNGAFIFHQLQQDTTVEKIVAEMKKTYSEPEEEIREAVVRVIEKLRADSLIED